MKNMIKVLVLAVAMITFNVSTYAQKSERQRMTCLLYTSPSPRD